MKKYHVCVVGVGAVGKEFVRLLHARRFPMDSLQILATSRREEMIAGKKYRVEIAKPGSFAGMDFAFFAGTEGAKGAAMQFAERAKQSGCIVIDNGDDFRMEPWVPLVIPEINPGALHSHQGLIANPNCSTIITLMALAPLHKAVGIKRFVASTYQAVSGTGTAAINELVQQTKDWVQGTTPIVHTDIYKHQILGNVIPSVGSFRDDSGDSTEEIKMRRETHKILDNSNIGIANTCVRVPVINGHSIAIAVELKRGMSVDWATRILSQTPGVHLLDNPADGIYPTPLQASGQDKVLVGRIRKDPSVEHGLLLWCSGDNLWKGAAQNAIQIAEHLIKSNLV